jgi:hypothetical protein
MYGYVFEYEFIFQRKNIYVVEKRLLATASKINFSLEFDETTM